jgi:hypothetical protein
MPRFTQETGTASGPASLHRRTMLGSMLRSAGVAIALPALEALRATSARAATPVPPTRMAFLYVPNGVNLSEWKPQGRGPQYRLGTSLAPLEPFRNDLQMISGLSHRSGFASGDGGGAHARAMATVLTGVRPRKTAGADIRAGISIDQVAANAIGQATRFPSLELSCDGVRKSGACDLGYSCAYSYNVSWRSANQPAVPESNPRLVFERMFGGGSASERAQNLRTRIASQRSVLDFVLDEVKLVDRRLDAADRRKLDEYLVSVRAIETQVERFERLPAPQVADGERPNGTPAAYPEHIRLLADMLVLAFRTDSTRIATFILGHDGGERTFPEIGVVEGHHTLSHHRGSPDSLAKIARVDRFYAWQLAYFLDRLQRVEEADGRSLLDHSMIVYASGLSDGDRHRHDDLPVIVAGRAGGRLAAGQHLALDRETPMTNLYLTLLDLLGAPQRQFGDSTGTLPGVLA